MLYEGLGRQEEAALLHEKSLAIWQKALGPDHPNVALSLSALAKLYNAKGRYETPLAYARRATTIYRTRAKRAAMLGSVCAWQAHVSLRCRFSAQLLTAAHRMDSDTTLPPA